MKKIFNLATVIKNKIKIRHTDELSLLLSVSVLTGLYNFETCIDIGLKYYEYSSDRYPIKVGKQGIQTLEQSKDTCSIIDICSEVCKIFDVEHNLKTSTKEFEEDFHQLYKMAIVTKHLVDFPTQLEPKYTLQK